MQKCGFGDMEKFICFECVSKYSCCHCDDDCCPNCSHETTCECCGSEVLCGNNLKGDESKQFCAGNHETKTLDCGHVGCNYCEEDHGEGSCRTCAANKRKLEQESVADAPSLLKAKSAVKGTKDREVKHDSNKAECLEPIHPMVKRKRSTDDADN